MIKYNSFTYLIAVVFGIFVGCKQEQTMEEQMDSKHTICYGAISQSDTAWLKIDTSGRQIKGLLNFSYEPSDLECPKLSVNVRICQYKYSFLLVFFEVSPMFVLLKPRFLGET